MKYSRFIDCKIMHEIRKDVLNFLPGEIPSSLFYINNNKELFLGIEQLKKFFVEMEWLQYVRSFAFNVVSNKSSGIHIDTGESGYSLNFPIQNCSGSIINFYRSNTDPIIKEYKLYNTTVTYKHFLPEQCEKIDSIVIDDKPYLMKIHVPHNIEHPGAGSRVTLLTRFYREFDIMYERDGRG